MIGTEVHGLAIRPYRIADVRDLRREADDPRIAANLRDRFPHPYTLRHAWQVVAGGDDRDPLEFLAITRDDRVIGGIGASAAPDGRRVEAEVGYWLGVDHWGHGYATAALRAFTHHLFATTVLQRLVGIVMHGNVASCRVLEKCGFVRDFAPPPAAAEVAAVAGAHRYVRRRDIGSGRTPPP